MTKKYIKVIKKIIISIALLMVFGFILIVAWIHSVGKIENEYRSDLRLQHYTEGLEIIRAIDSTMIQSDTICGPSIDSLVSSFITNDSFPYWRFSLNTYRGSYTLGCSTASAWPISIGVHLTYFSDENRWEFVCDGSRWSPEREFGEGFDESYERSPAVFPNGESEIFDKAIGFYSDSNYVNSLIYLDILKKETVHYQDTISDLRTSILVEWLEVQRKAEMDAMMSSFIMKDSTVSEND